MELCRQPGRSVQLHAWAEPRHLASPIVSNCTNQNPGNLFFEAVSVVCASCNYCTLVAAPAVCPCTCAGYQQQDAHEFYLSALSGMSGATLPTRTELASAGPSSGGLGPPSSDGGFLPGSMVAGCGAPEAAAAESR